MRTMHFLDLFEDILLKIAYECTAIDIFTLERSCRTLRDFFSQSNRPLWLHILGKLDEHHAPDLPPHIALDSLSSDQLKDLVMRAAVGHANWSRSSSSGPRVTRKRIIDLKNKGGMLGDLKQDEHYREIVKIVRGALGDEFLFVLWSEGYLQCWDVRKNVAIWTFPQLGTFQSDMVRAYDAEYDSEHGLLFVVIMGELSAELRGWSMKSFWLDPETKRATPYKTSRSFVWRVPRSLELCGDTVILIGNTGVAIANKALSKCFRLSGVEIVTDSITVSDNHLLFVGKEGRDKHYSLIALQVQQLLTHPRIRGAACGFQPDFNGFSIGEELRNLRIKEPLPILSGQFVSVRLVPCKMTWHGVPKDTTIFAIGKLNDAFASGNRTQGKSEDTRFWLSSFQFSTYTGECSSLPPSLTLQRGSLVSIPLSHPYCVEDVHSLSHGGRGILASANILHGATRYYAFMFEDLLEGRTPGPSGPLSFGRDYVAPSNVYFEKYSGTLVYVSKDQQKLVIQHYD